MRDLVKTSGREAALKALFAFRKNGINSNAYLDGIIRHENMDSREAALMSRIFLGVLQNIALLDFYIRSFSKRDKIDPEVLDILRISVYQIVFLDKIPISAAVNEGVKLAKKYAAGKDGFVNAVLRRVSENADKLPEPPKNDLALRYSHPKELTDYIVSRLDRNEAEAFLNANNAVSRLKIRLNRLKCEPEILERILAETELSYKKDEYYEDFYDIIGLGKVEESGAFNEGFITVQDPASALSVKAAGARPGMHVLDACAAPGGKSFLLAQYMQNSGSIAACDINEKKLKKIEEGAQRLGAEIIKTRCMDASKPYEGFINAFDLVFCDAPCSGLGVISKKPEIRYKSFGEIARLPEIQLSILKNLADYVKPGGVLLYSTCTIIKAENEDTVEAFLKVQGGFTPEAFELPEPIGRVPEGFVTLWPQKHGTDGFFICKMRKSL